MSFIVRASTLNTKLEKEPHWTLMGRCYPAYYVWVSYSVGSTYQCSRMTEYSHLLAICPWANKKISNLHLCHHQQHHMIASRYVSHYTKPISKDCIINSLNLHNDLMGRYYYPSLQMRKPRHRALNLPKATKLSGRELYDLHPGNLALGSVFSLTTSYYLFNNFLKA